MNRLGMLVGGVVAVVVVCVVGIAVVFVGAVGSVCGPAVDVSTSPSGPGVGARWDEAQLRNATTIVLVGRSMQVPPRGWIIALATAMQESGLRNLGDLGPDNDHDSLGLFQQRPSQGWGTAEQIMNPEYASTKFYQKLTRVARWTTMPLTDAAQAVQRSAYPDAYAKHEALATVLAHSIAGTAADCLAGVAGGGWLMPVSGPVVSGFRTDARPGHDGVDLAVARGTPIRAAAAGVVITVTCNASLNGQPYPCDRDGSPAVAGCGYYSEILHAGDIVSRYCHQLVSPPLTVGQAVAAGQVIGLVGSSGNSSGPHLHLEFHRGYPATPDNAVDPVMFLRSVGVTVAP